MKTVLLILAVITVLSLFGTRMAIFRKRAEISGYGIEGIRRDLFYGNRESGLAELKRVLRNEPANIPALKTAGRFFIEEGDQKIAVEMLERGLAIIPDDSELLLLRGRAYFLSGEPDKGIQFLFRAAEAAGKAAEAHIELQRLYLSWGMEKEALKHSERARILLEPWSR